jgi:hypothetical protein
MKLCPNCQTELVETARFCHQCGRSLDLPATGVTVPLVVRDGLRCAACGNTSPPDARYCIQCGVALPTAIVVAARPRQPVIVNGIAEPELWTIGALAAAGLGGLLIFWFRLPPLLMLLPIAIGQALFLFGRNLYFIALRNAFWLIGLLVLWRTPSLVVPGLIVLALLTWLLHRLFADGARR